MRTKFAKLKAVTFVCVAHGTYTLFPASQSLLCPSSLSFCHPLSCQAPHSRFRLHTSSASSTPWLWQAASRMTLNAPQLLQPPSCGVPTPWAWDAPNNSLPTHKIWQKAQEVTSEIKLQKDLLSLLLVFSCKTVGRAATLRSTLCGKEPREHSRQQPARNSDPQSNKPQLNPANRHMSRFGNKSSATSHKVKPWNECSPIQKFQPGNGPVQRHSAKTSWIRKSEKLWNYKCTLF